MVYLQRWHVWCHMKLQPSRRKFCVHHTTMLQAISCKTTYARCICLAVTCHLYFWQNDRDLLRATAVTRGWNGYRNKSQHRKSTLEKKILPPFLQGFEPATFQSRVWRSNHWAIPAPKSICSDCRARHSHSFKLHVLLTVITTFRTRSSCFPALAINTRIA